MQTAGLRLDRVVPALAVTQRACAEDAARNARISRVRAEKARRMAEIWERKARHLTERGPLYLAEANRLRSAAEGHEAEAAWQDGAADAARALVGAWT